MLFFFRQRIDSCFEKTNDQTSSNFQVRLIESESFIDLVNRRILEEKNKKQTSNFNTEKSETNDFEPFDKVYQKLLMKNLRKEIEFSLHLKLPVVFPSSILNLGNIQSW